jgi:hypothetical protein
MGIAADHKLQPSTTLSIQHVDDFIRNVLSTQNRKSGGVGGNVTTPADKTFCHTGILKTPLVFGQTVEDMSQTVSVHLAKVSDKTYAGEAEKLPILKLHYEMGEYFSICSIFSNLSKRPNLFNRITDCQSFVHPQY